MIKVNEYAYDILFLHIYDKLVACILLIMVVFLLGPVAEILTAGLCYYYKLGLVYGTCCSNVWRGTGTPPDVLCSLDDSQ